jgi:hypothetical protein
MDKMLRYCRVRRHGRMEFSIMHACAAYVHSKDTDDHVRAILYINYMRFTKVFQVRVYHCERRDVNEWLCAVARGSVGGATYFACRCSVTPDRTQFQDFREDSAASKTWKRQKVNHAMRCREFLSFDDHEH